MGVKNYSSSDNLHYSFDSKSIKSAYVDKNKNIHICFEGFEELNKIKTPSAFMVTISNERLNKANSSRAKGAIHSFIYVSSSELEKCNKESQSNFEELPIMHNAEGYTLESMQKNYGKKLYVAEYNRYMAAIPVQENNNESFVLLSSSGYNEKSTGRKAQILILYPLAFIGDVITSPFQLIYIGFAGTQSWK
jgi:hypothetical protein